MFKRAAIAAAVAAAVIASAIASPVRAQNRDTGPVLTLTAQGPGVVTGADLSNSTNNLLHCVVNISAMANQPTVLVVLQGKDQASAQYYPLVGSPAMFGPGLVELLVGLGAPPGPLSANKQVPTFWRAVATVLGPSNATATGTVGCSATY